MSSPADAVAALENRRTALGLAEDAPDYKPIIYESGEDQTADEHPTPPIRTSRRRSTTTSAGGCAISLVCISSVRSRALSAAGSRRAISFAGVER
jgi:hypothetical protein